MLWVQAGSETRVADDVMRPRELLLEAKSLVRKLLGIPDPWKAFRDYERRIRSETWTGQPAVLRWLEEVAPIAASPPRPVLDPTSSDPLVRLFALRWSELEKQFAGKHASLANEFRVLIHLPPFPIAAAGYSLFQNLGQGLTFCGVPVAFWEHWGGGPPLAQLLDEFRPGVLLSIDHRWYGPNPPVGQDSIEAVREYRRKNRLILGLSCNHFPTDPVILDRNIADATSLGVDFFYSFQAEPFVSTKYRPFIDRWFRVLSLEFGANPLQYHPVPGIERDLNFVYLAANNAEKWERETKYLRRVFHTYPGLILGPGWPRTTVAQLPPHQLRFLYARAKVGINLHVPFQIADPTELNERAYNLAACGTPQLMDRPALLPNRFSEAAIFSADTPDQYIDLFEHILAHPEEAAERGRRSMGEVLDNHTVFHRADTLIRFLARCEDRSTSKPC